MRLQTTIGNTTTLHGIGLHRGEAASLTLKPAAPGTGIRFVRSRDGQDDAHVQASFDYVSDTNLCTTLDNGAPNGARAQVRTVEHLMAAIHVCGIDNLDVVMPQEEVPIMDGSAAPFVEAIHRSGTVHLNAVARQWVVKHLVEIRDGERYAALQPHPFFALDFTIVYDDTPIGTQMVQVDEFDNLEELVMPARTFGLMRDVEMMRNHNLALGGSLDNAVVVDDQGVVNEGGLRFDDEFVRHKVLDAIGDLALAGAPIRGKYTGLRAGHELNNKLLRKAFATEGAMQLVQYSAPSPNLAQGISALAM